jgi:hypothetical protein
MIEVAQDHQSLLDDVMRFPALDMGDETHATGVVFIAWVVKTLCARLFHLSIPEEGEYRL